MHVAPRAEKNGSLYSFCAMMAASAEMRDTASAWPKEPTSVCIPCRPTWRVLEKSTPAFLAQSSNFTEAISIPTIVPSVPGCSGLAKSPRPNDVESEILLEDLYNQDKRRDEFMKFGGLDFSRIEVVKHFAAAAAGAKPCRKGHGCGRMPRAGTETLP